MSYQINVKEVAKETLNIIIHKPVILLPMFILVLFYRMLDISGKYFLNIPDSFNSIGEITPIIPSLLIYIFIQVIILSLIYTIVDGMYPLLIKNILENKDIDTKTVAKLTLKRASILLAAGVLVSFIVLAGTVLFIIPGVIFMIWYFYVIPFIVLENRGVLDGMRASKKFSSDKKYTTLYLTSVPVLILIFGDLIVNVVHIIIPTFFTTFPYVYVIINIIIDSFFITWFSVIPSYVYIKSHENKHHIGPDHITKKSPTFRKNLLMLGIILGALIVSSMIFTPDSNAPNPSPADNYVPEKSTSNPLHAPDQNSKNYTNSIGMDFVLISAGEFDMGSPSDEEGRYGREGPVHKVNISYGFYLGKYEVTQKQWLEVMGSNPSLFKGDDLPVESVSWYDVQEFITKLNTKEGTDKYRLPSEAEWEYAARAGTTTPHSFGEWKLIVDAQGVVLSCISCSPQSFSESGLIAQEGELIDIETTLEKIRRANELMIDGYAWHKGNSGGETHYVGQKMPNPWGLYDMHGNVWEWIADSYHGDYEGTPTDGSVWEGGNGRFWDLFGQKKVIRGSSWYGINCCRSAFRNSGSPDQRNPAIGFRLVMMY